MGRSIYCSKCKREKEESVRNESYCKACKYERQKKAKIQKRLSLGLPPERPIRVAYCNNCIAKLEKNEDIRGRCSECHRIGQQLRVEAKRVAQGLPAKTSRNSEFCYVCNIPKVDGRCVPCRNKRRSERKKKIREEKGLRPWGSGRPLTCYKCGNIKEVPTASLCNTCSNEDSRRHWKEVVAPRMNQRPITLICECGKEKTSTRKIYCNDCLLERKRKSTREAAQRKRKSIREKGYSYVAIPLTEQEKVMRKAARDFLQRMIKQEVVKRLDCEVCGSNKNVEAHHDDYTKPLEVIWLCKKHHAEHHRINPNLEE